MRGSRILKLLSRGTLIVLSTALVLGQSLPSSGMQYLETIGIPGWKATGTSGNANVDLMGYNPVTRMMYLADRTNHGIDVIDTRVNVVVGLIKMPPTSVYGTPVTGPNGVLVAVNSQQLVVTDGLQSVYVWDLRAPQANPDVYTFPKTMGIDTDGIAYDPINQTVYVVTDVAPEYLIGISLPYKQVVTQAALPVSSDLIAFSPTDGKIYVGTEDADGGDANAAAGVIAFDPATNAFTQVAKIGPTCPGHGIDIDAIANVAVVGCAGAQAQANVAVNLATGAVQTFGDVGGTDVVVFNPSTRRFYMNGTNFSTAANCREGIDRHEGNATEIDLLISSHLAILRPFWNRDGCAASGSPLLPAALHRSGPGFFPSASLFSFLTYFGHSCALTFTVAGEPGSTCTLAPSVGSRPTKSTCEPSWCANAASMYCYTRPPNMAGPGPTGPAVRTEASAQTESGAMKWWSP
jgi:hypothetical protein